MAAEDEADEKESLGLVEGRGPNGAGAAAVVANRRLPKPDPFSRLVAAYVPARYLMSAMSFVGLAIIYGLKVNLSTAIVVMVNYTADSTVHHAKESPCHGSMLKAPDGPLPWDEETRGHILAAYFYGYLVGQLPGGYLSSKSAKWTFFVAVAVNAAGTVIAPAVCLNTHWIVYLLVRVAMGATAGLTFPVTHQLISAWIPTTERGAIGGAVYAGTAFGTVVSVLMTGFISDGLGWEWSFYIMGILCVPWCLCWAWWAADCPEDALYIAEKERDFLRLNVQGRSQVAPKFPLRPVFTSTHFWAIMVAHFGGNCGWYFILTELPSFMKEVLHKNIKENAVMSAIPYFLFYVMSTLTGVVLDAARNRGKITRGVARKIATGLCTVFPAACMVGISFIGCDSAAGTAVIIVAVAFQGSMFVGYLSNHMDISPNFSGMLMAITNTVATIPGIAMPIITSAVVENNHTIERWSIIFYALAVIYVISFVVFTIWGSGEVQWWNEGKPSRRQSRTLSNA